MSEPRHRTRRRRPARRQAVVTFQVFVEATSENFPAHYKYAVDHVMDSCRRSDPERGLISLRAYNEKGEIFDNRSYGVMSEEMKRRVEAIFAAEMEPQPKENGAA